MNIDVTPNQRPTTATTTTDSFGIESTYREILRKATDLFQTRPQWSTYFRQILSVNGYIRERLQTPEAIHRFEQTEEFAEIQKMLGVLRQRKREPKPNEETKVITVRIPASMHEWLLNEASESGTSMNRLCVAKLLQILDDDVVK